MIVMSIDAYAKTASSVAGGIVAWGTAAATLFALVPDKRTAALVTGLLLIVHAAQSFSVWLTTNRPVIDADVSAVQSVLTAIGDWRGAVAELKTLIENIVHPPASGGAA